MHLELHLNARFQPKHRFELEDALQEILQESQIPRSKLSGHQICNAAELRGIRPSRQSPNIRASAAAWLVARGNKAGEITGGGTSLKKNGEIGSCDIDIDFSDAQKSLEWLVNLLNTIGIPKGSVLRGIEPPINVGTTDRAKNQYKVKDLQRLNDSYHFPCSK